MPPSGYIVITIAVPDVQAIDKLRRIKDGRYVETRQDIIREAVQALKIIRENE